MRKRDLLLGGALGLLNVIVGLLAPGPWALLVIAGWILAERGAR